MPKGNLSPGHYSLLMSKLSPFHFRFDEANLAYGYLVFASVLLALIPTFFGSLDLHVARLFFFPRVIDSSAWRWVQFLNDYTPTIFRALMLICTILWLISGLQVRWKKWRLALAFVVLAGIAGPGLAVNGIVKPLWERARPSQIQEFGGTQEFSQAGVFAEECSKDCSFVSGHAACGFFFSSLCLIFRKRRAALMAFGFLAGAMIGFARISGMHHWLSDVLWAFPVTLLSSWAVWWLLQAFEPKVRLQTEYCE